MSNKVVVKITLDKEFWKKLAKMYPENKGNAPKLQLSAIYFLSLPNFYFSFIFIFFTTIII